MNETNGQNKRNGHIKQTRLGGVENEGGSFGNEQNKIVDFDSKGANCYESDSIRRRRRVIGGILSQLINDTEDQLAFSKKQITHYQNQVRSLEKKLSYLKKLEIIDE